MNVALRLNNVFDLIGPRAYFNSFFVTIHENLEAGSEWGSNYPALLKELYAGVLHADRGAVALEELKDVTLRFRTLSPSDVILEHDGQKAEVPWGDDVRSGVVDLSNYFATSTGRDMIESMREGFEWMAEHGGDMTVVSYGGKK